MTLIMNMVVVVILVLLFDVFCQISIKQVATVTKLSWFVRSQHTTVGKSMGPRPAGVAILFQSRSSLRSDELYLRGMSRRLIDPAGRLLALSHLLLCAKVALSHSNNNNHM